MGSRGVIRVCRASKVTSLIAMFEAVSTSVVGSRDDRGQVLRCTSTACLRLPPTARTRSGGQGPGRLRAARRSKTWKSIARSAPTTTNVSRDFVCKLAPRSEYANDLHSCCLCVQIVHGQVLRPARRDPNLALDVPKHLQPLDPPRFSNPKLLNTPLEPSFVGSNMPSTTSMPFSRFT